MFPCDSKPLHNIRQYFKHSNITLYILTSIAIKAIVMCSDFESVEYCKNNRVFQSNFLMYPIKVIWFQTEPF